MTSQEPAQALGLRVGFIGLGDQGAPIAQRIAEAGWPLTVYARRPEGLEPFAPPVQIAASAAELGAGCDVVEICVVDDAGVDDVVLTQGLLEAMTPGSILVVHSTVLPDTVRRISSLAREKGVEFLDAPLSGGRASAVVGKMTVMVGGDRSTLERCEPVFRSFATTVRPIGPVGHGQMIKLVNNLVLAWNIVNAERGLALATEFGLDEDTTNETVAASMGQSRGHELYRSSYRERPGVLAHGLGMLGKDLGLLQQVLVGTDWEPQVVGVRRDLEGVRGRLLAAAG